MFLLTLFLASCGPGGSKVEVTDPPINIDTIEGEVSYVGPPPVIEEPKPDSPFYTLGCCNDIKQNMDDCCCLKILEKYSQMRMKNDSRLAQLKQTDVLLNNCNSHKNYKAKFQAVDYPEGNDDL